MWPEFRKYLKSISAYDYDLFVTMVDKDPTMQKDIIDFKPNTKILFCENRGYDIRPFVIVMRSVDVHDYSYVVKMHTKRDLQTTAHVNGYYFKGKTWRNMCCSFLRSQGAFSSVVEMLEGNPKIGMCGTQYLTIEIQNDKDEGASQKYYELLTENNLPLIPHSFVGGTIFIARSEVFDMLRYLDLNAFESEIQHGGQYAHAVERFFGYCVAAHNMQVMDAPRTKLNHSLQIFRLYHLRKVCRFFYLHEVNKAGIMRLKICRIPLPRAWFIKE